MTNEKALNCIKVEKEIVERKIDFPKQNEFLILNAISKHDSSEKFIVDINRKRAILSRCSFQERVHTNIQLIRLDVDTKIHRNPDGELLEGTHIHIYEEGYGLAWAYLLNHAIINQINPNFNIDLLKDLSRHDQTFINFCHLCNITKIPLTEINFL